MLAPFETGQLKYRHFAIAHVCRLNTRIRITLRLVMNVAIIHHCYPHIPTTVLVYIVRLP